MTRVQLIYIKQRRLQGIGYRKIAGEMGVSRDVVRNYCKSHLPELVGYGKNIKRMPEKISICLCQNCGADLHHKATGRPRKFCSDECRRSWWKEHAHLLMKSDKAMYSLTCTYCNKEYISYGNQKRKYCSHDCYIKDRFWTEEEICELK